MRLRLLGAALLVVLPLAMWVANRSAPLLMGLCAAALIAAAVLAEGLQPLLRRLRRLLGNPIGIAVSVFLLWSLISVGWSHRVAGGLAMWGEFALPLIFGIAVVASGQLRPDATFARALGLALAAASLLMLLELNVGLTERVMLGLGKGVHRTDVFNRPVLTCLILTAAVLPQLWSAGTWRDRALAIFVALAVAAVTLASESGAAKLGLAVMAMVWLAAWLAPRLTLTMVALGFTLTMMAAPMIGEIVDRTMPASLHKRMADAHSRARVDIWLTFGEVIRAHPFIGSGFGATAALDRHPVARQVSPPHQAMLGVGHPHSAPIQAWAETGLVGAGLLWFAGLMTLLRLRRLPVRDLAPRLGLFAAAFSVASVGHGAWQGWWIASLAAGAAILWTAREPARSPSSDVQEQRHG